MADDEERLPSALEDFTRRGPMVVRDDTDEEELAAQMQERLEALLERHMCQPDAEGWRQLALELALKYDPLFRIETPVDRTGRSGIGGRPVDMKNFGLRSRMKSKMREGLSQAEAARAISRETKGAVHVKTLQNALSRKPPSADWIRLRKYTAKAERALKAAGKQLSQQWPVFLGR